MPDTPPPKTEGLQFGAIVTASCLLLIVFIVGVYRLSYTVPVAEQPLRSAPVMAWGGESVQGYLRVELLNEQAEVRPRDQVLVVCDNNGRVFSYHGLMIDMPWGLLSSTGTWSAFVRSPTDIGTDHLTPAMVAVVSPVGVLRLFAFTSTTSGATAPELLPFH